MDKSKQILTKVKNHVAANKAAYVMGGVAVTTFALMQRSHRQFNEFLTDKGIDPDEYWCPEYYEEKQSLKGN